MKKKCKPKKMAEGGMVKNYVEKSAGKQPKNYVELPKKKGSMLRWAKKYTRKQGGME